MSRGWKPPQRVPLQNYAGCDLTHSRLNDHDNRVHVKDVDTPDVDNADIPANDDMYDM